MSSDGTTAVQVSPIPTESEMASIRAFFANVTNALVNASELSVKVKDLEARFAQLNSDHTAVMARNDELVSSLHEVRTQRDDAQSNLIAVMASLSDAQHEIGMLTNQAQGNADEISNLKAELAKSKADYAEAMNAWHASEGDLMDAKGQLAKIKGALGIVDPPKPEPIPPQAEPIPEVRPLSEAEANVPKPEPEKYEPTTWDPNKF